MVSKKFILNADDFGMSNAFNRAVLDGYNSGFLKSASLCANGEAFESAVNEIIPECPDLGVGVHINIIEGKALQDFTKTSLLTDMEGNFKNSYLKMILLSKNPEFLSQVEAEFRAQIEKVQRHLKITHLDSHVHVHAIPPIFEVLCKLAKEYGIKQVRTQREKFYIVPNLRKNLNFKYPINLLKILLLKAFTCQNIEVIKEYELTTNDYLIGVGYTGMMDSSAVKFGLESIKGDYVVESLIHPCNYNNTFQGDSPKKDYRYNEFLITQDKDLLYKIQRMGFEISNYK